MGIVLLCLILGLALAIERIIYLNMATTDTDKLLSDVEGALQSGGVESAKEVCRNTKGPVASIFYQGLDRSKDGVDSAEKAVIAYGGVQMGQLEKNVSWISLFIALAPMLGFMGTVIGMINAFDKIPNQPFNFGVYKIELFIDNELLYSINFDKYSFSQDDLIYNEVDYHLIQKGSVFHRLFSSNKNKLNFIEINNPFILLDNNYHNMIINISDINNNKIQLQGIILGKMLTNNNIFSFVDSNNTIIKFQNENTTINLKSRFKDQNNALSPTSLMNSRKINIDQLVPPYDVIEYYYSNSSGISTRKEYLSFKKLNPYEINGAVSLKHLDNGIIIEFEEELFSGYNPTLELLTDNNKKVFNLYRKEKNLLSSKIDSYN